MVHSQSGAYGMDLVRARAVKMLGFVNIEGNCAPVTADEVVKIFSKVPLLSVWGDNSRGAPGPNGDERRDACATTVTAIKSAGGSAKFLLLPEAGHKGNSHMLMMDKNNLRGSDHRLARRERGRALGRDSSLRSSAVSPRSNATMTRPERQAGLV